MKKTSYEQYFKDKKITYMTGECFDDALEDIKLLAHAGAEITVTHHEPAETIKKQLRQLKRFKNISYTLGHHSVHDFRHKDFVIHNNENPFTNKYIGVAREESIPVYTPVSLLCFIIRDMDYPVQHIGIAGTKGKTTTLGIIEHILNYAEARFFVHGGNSKNSSLAILKKIEPGNIILSEFFIHHLESLHSIHYSPHISVLTNVFEDNLNHYGSMKKYFSELSAVFKYHTHDDHLILGHNASKIIKKYYKQTLQGTKTLARFNHLPKSWEYQIFGKHNERNISQAYQVAKTLGLGRDVIKTGITTFKGSPGRFQNIGTSSTGIIFYNDSYSNAPEATVTSLLSLKRAYPNKQIILIAGGKEKGYHYQKLAKFIARHISFTFLLSGPATDKLRSCFPAKFESYLESMSLKTALNIAVTQAESGDIIIFSPGASAGAIFDNEQKRNDEYIKLVKQLLKK